jgi:hypothetical protein
MRALKFGHVSLQIIYTVITVAAERSALMRGDRGHTGDSTYHVNPLSAGAGVATASRKGVVEITYAIRQISDVSTVNSCFRADFKIIMQWQYVKNAKVEEGVRKNHVLQGEDHELDGSVRGPFLEVQNLRERLEVQVPNVVVDEDKLVSRVRARRSWSCVISHSTHSTCSWC